MTGIQGRGIVRIRILCVEGGAALGRVTSQLYNPLRSTRPALEERIEGAERQGRAGALNSDDEAGPFILAFLAWTRLDP